MLSHQKIRLNLNMFVEVLVEVLSKFVGFHFGVGGNRNEVQDRWVESGSG